MTPPRARRDSKPQLFVSIKTKVAGPGPVKFLHLLKSDRTTQRAKMEETKAAPPDNYFSDSLRWPAV